MKDINERLTNELRNALPLHETCFGDRWNIIKTQQSDQLEKLLSDSGLEFKYNSDYGSIEDNTKGVYELKQSVKNVNAILGTSMNHYIEFNYIVTDCEATMKNIVQYLKDNNIVVTYEIDGVILTKLGSDLIGVMESFDNTNKPNYAQFIYLLGISSVFKTKIETNYESIIIQGGSIVQLGCTHIAWDKITRLMDSIGLKHASHLDSNDNATIVIENTEHNNNIIRSYENPHVDSHIRIINFGHGVSGFFVGESVYIITENMGNSVDIPSFTAMCYSTILFKNIKYHKETRNKTCYIEIIGSTGIKPIERPTHIEPYRVLMKEVVLPIVCDLELTQYNAVGELVFSEPTELFEKSKLRAHGNAIYFKSNSEVVYDYVEQIHDVLSEYNNESGIRTFKEFYTQFFAEKISLNLIDLHVDGDIKLLFTMDNFNFDTYDQINSILRSFGIDGISGKSLYDANSFVIYIDYTMKNAYRLGVLAYENEQDEHAELTKELQDALGDGIKKDDYPKSIAIDLLPNKPMDKPSLDIIDMHQEKFTLDQQRILLILNTCDVVKFERESYNTFSSNTYHGSDIHCVVTDIHKFMQDTKLEYQLLVRISDDAGYIFIIKVDDSEHNDVILNDPIRLDSQKLLTILNTNKHVVYEMKDEYKFEGIYKGDKIFHALHDINNLLEELNLEGDASCMSGVFTLDVAPTQKNKEAIENYYREDDCVETFMGNDKESVNELINFISIYTRIQFKFEYMTANEFMLSTVIPRPNTHVELLNTLLRRFDITFSLNGDKMSLFFRNTANNLNALYEFRSGEFVENTHQKTFESILSELRYVEKMTADDDRADMIDNMHLGDTISAIQYNLDLARNSWYNNAYPHTESMAYLRKVAGLIIRMGLVCDIPKR